MEHKYIIYNTSSSLSLHKQDMTQGYILKWSLTGLHQSFLSPRPLVISSLKSSVCPTIYPSLEDE